MKLTPAQVAGYALAAGFQGHGATKAVAVALAESGGNTSATNVNHDRYRSRDRGLWQINSHWHPEVTDAAAYDPAQAAAAAYRISHAGRDWSAWSTWTNGKAAAMTGRARLAVAQARKGGGRSSSATNAGLHIPNPFDLPAIPAPPGLPLPPGFPIPNPFSDQGQALGGQLLGGVGDVTGAIVQLNTMVLHAALWVGNPHNWLRVLFVAGGAVAVVGGAVLLAESGAAGSTAANAARTTTNAAKSTGKAAAAVALVPK